MTERDETMWCVDCGGRFTEEEVTGATCCPKCKSGGVPADTAKDVVVEVNWHELRILGIWAENWAVQHARETANGMVNTVHSITRRLQQQFPELAALTLSQEIAELPSNLAKGGIEVSKIETDVPKPPLQVVNGNGAIGHACKWPENLGDRLRASQSSDLT